MATAVATKVLALPNCLNPLIHIKAAGGLNDKIFDRFEEVQGHESRRHGDERHDGAPGYAVTKIAEVLLANRISAVPVVNDKDAVVGIVSRANLIQALVNFSHEKSPSAPIDDLILRDNILDQLRSKPRVDPSIINVVVNNGIVESEAEKDTTRVAVEFTPDVRQVANKLVVEHLMNAQ